jgi:hypothetical protein
MLTVYVRSFASVNILAPGTVVMVQLIGVYEKGEAYVVRIVQSVGPTLIFEIKYE